MSIRGAALLLSSFALAACVAPSGEGVDSSADAVVAGEVTLERPWIGAFKSATALCTGTLIREDIVLTAAHCMPLMTDQDVSAESYRFEITTEDGARHTYKVDRMTSVLEQKHFDGTQAWRAHDMTVAHLAEKVPADVAPPAVLATAWPEAGTEVALYGYGCTDWNPGPNGRRPGAGTKRKAAYTWSEDPPQRMCAGDSGGPLMHLADNAVLGINSGVVNGHDRWGDVPLNVPRIEEIIAGWSTPTP